MSQGRARSKGFVFVFLFLISLGLFAQTNVLLTEDLKEAILSELSGLRPIDFISYLCTFDRSGASEGLYESQKWVMEKLKSWGILDVQLLRFPADGEKIYLDTHPAGYAWEKRSAVLSLVEPLRRKIIDYAEIPTSLVQYSNSADVTAELVDIGEGLVDENYAGKDVKGKIVFTSGNASAVYPLAIEKYGAIGIVSCWKNYEPDRSRYPDQVPWMSIRQELNTHAFGFSVSRNIADELRGLLLKGKVVVRARVDAEIRKGNYYVLSSSLPGKSLPDEEIILMAHINHHKPGANDNASGCALLMEIEKSIKTLVDTGRIAPPRRTIRFLWMNEHVGSKIYIDSRPDIREKAVAAVNLDMVGENILLTESVLRLTLAPHSCPSFLDDLMNHLLRYISETNFGEYRGTKIPFTYVLEKYNGGISDHYWYLSGGVSVPTSFLYLYPDNFYHTQEDTPDKCDPTMLKRVGFAAMAAALYLSGAGDKEAADLCRLVSAEGSKRIIQAAKEAQDDLKIRKKGNLSGAYKEAILKLEKVHEKEKIALQSGRRLAATPKIRTEIERRLEVMDKIKKAQRELLEKDYLDFCSQAGQKPEKIGRTAEEKKFARFIPQRQFRGPLNLTFIKTKISKEKARWYDEAAERIPDFFVVQDEIANFINNQNSILDIRNAVSAEFAPIALEDVFDFIDGIREAGLVTFKER